MLMLGSYLKKFFFGANGQLRGLEIVGEEWEILLREIFFLVGGNLMSNFDHLKCFQSLKRHSVHIDHQLISTLA